MAENFTTWDENYKHTHSGSPKEHKENCIKVLQNQISQNMW